MARSSGPNQDPPLTAERIAEGREILLWARTLEQHRIMLEEWLALRRLARAA